MLTFQQLTTEQCGSQMQVNEMDLLLWRQEKSFEELKDEWKVGATSRKMAGMLHSKQFKDERMADGAPHTNMTDLLQPKQMNGFVRDKQTEFPALISVDNSLCKVRGLGGIDHCYGPPRPTCRGRQNSP
eukprot:c48667_g1_i1 orf=84-470(-)